MSFMSKQTKGSGILSCWNGSMKTIVIVKHITKIKFEPSSSYPENSNLHIYTSESKYSTSVIIAKTEEKALLYFISSEQNLVKPKSVTDSILAAAGLI